MPSHAVLPGNDASLQHRDASHASLVLLAPTQLIHIAIALFFQCDSKAWYLVIINTVTDQRVDERAH